MYTYIHEYILKVRLHNTSRNTQNLVRKCGLKTLMVLLDTFHLVTQVDTSFVLFLLLVECQER